ncbi:hypothetical protein B0H12DRAFT_1121999 [Mycena haematopus]|nr:hypothetical protein B0H12DRAFT_1121999 [Mycena haematopus]
MSSSPTAEELDQLYQTIGDFYKANLNAVAALSWLVYDIIVTLDQEVNRMWRAKFSVPTFIYFATRYYGLLYMMYDHGLTLCSVSTNYSLPEKVNVSFCRGWGPFEAASVQFLSMAVNALLAIRIDAFYNRSTRVRVFLVFIYIGINRCFSAEVAFSTLTGIDSADAQIHPSGVPLPGCIANSTPRFGLAAWVTNLVYQALCFSLGLYKFFSVFRGDKEVSGSRLAMMFVRDGAMFFLMQVSQIYPLLHPSDVSRMFGANMVNIILNFGVPKSPLLQICVPWLIATFSVGAPRIILNLKSAANSRSFTSEFEMHVRTHDETLVFASRPEHRRTTFDADIES